MPLPTSVTELSVPTDAVRVTVPWLEVMLLPPASFICTVMVAESVPSAASPASDDEIVDAAVETGPICAGEFANRNCPEVADVRPGELKVSV